LVLVFVLVRKYYFVPPVPRVVTASSADVRWYQLLWSLAHSVPSTNCQSRLF